MGADAPGSTERSPKSVDGVTAHTGESVMHKRIAAAVSGSVSGTLIGVTVQVRRRDGCVQRCSTTHVFL